MQLQPIALNVFAQDPAPQAQPGQSTAASPLGDAGNSPFAQVLARAEQIAQTQDKRIAADLNAYARGRSSTARTLGLLQLQYDLDDMQVSATTAKNIASSVGQALTTLTQRT
ncbi:MAG TPA: hypothetical protein VGG24_08785 [Paraburkholderia sp.]